MKNLIFLIPFLLLIDSACVTGICWLLSQPDDLGVILGVIAICFFFYVHYKIIIRLTTKIKN